ncbi:hypothetical protein RFI_17483 [Reticulomyxa filosa]|uniref:Uncharacterized protein n=1 Tax=Reticulomyxa filosa TaxID=46433 RepID=X6N359_RETFI|nr:hypothetical protein RFI_17483 [Reticulomyxa filosa]|eukprot:ETO19747.1 hypothetical protein RFI_17483 [Reticulomyxa filosa]
MTKDILYLCTYVPVGLAIMMSLLVLIKVVSHYFMQSKKLLSIHLMGRRTNINDSVATSDDNHSFFLDDEDENDDNGNGNGNGNENDYHRPGENKDKDKDKDRDRDRDRDEDEAAVMSEDENIWGNSSDNVLFGRTRQSEHTGHGFTLNRNYVIRTVMFVAFFWCCGVSSFRFARTKPWPKEGRPLA